MFAYNSISNKKNKVVVFGLQENPLEDQESQNYIWKLELGHGQFGTVYLGTHKTTNEEVAVKIFYDRNSSQHQEIINRQAAKETKMLKMLKHDNIVQLIAIENEKKSGDHVIIMELCNGGSLMKLLRRPQNARGLSEDEFLRVVDHLTRGLKFLKLRDVIHRDVKPDNILRHVETDEDGNIVNIIYKLSDFGTARELPEDETFNTICGTEPYLHPHIYKAYKTNVKREFSAETELWSIGVTLFQIATGFLPFRVQDPQEIFTIYEQIKMTDGIVWAYQKQGEDIAYHKTLPETTSLSLGLRQLVSPIIAGLFIYGDDQKQWNFDKYHDEVVALLTRQVFDVFYVNEMQMLKVYLKSTNFVDFQNCVHQQTGISKENQSFFHEQNLIVNCVSDEFPFGDSDRLFLFDRSSSAVKVPTNDNFDSFDVFITTFYKYLEAQSKELRHNYKDLMKKYIATTPHRQKVARLFGPSFVKDFIQATDDLVVQVSKLFGLIAATDTETIKTSPDFKIQHWYEHVFASRMRALDSLREHLKVYTGDFEKFENESNQRLNRLIATLGTFKKDSPDVNSIISETVEIRTKIESLLDSSFAGHEWSA